MVKIEGRIIVLEDMIQVTEKFAKRELVVETNDEKYPQRIPMQFVQDKCSVLDSYKVGDRVEVSANINGRDWVSPQGETKYFLSLNAWKIEKVISDSSIELHGEQANAINDEGMMSDMSSEEDDDLPF